MQTLGHYSLMDELGQGGMGTVYRALDTHLDRYIALKVLRSDIKVDAQARARFTQEAKAASALNHPNIVHIYDVGEENGVDYIAMEYIAGTTLDPLLTGLPLPIDQTLNHSIQIADALAAAHRAGIVHRDLKPGNVMVNERGLVKVLDFGLAKLTERTPSAGSAPGDAPTLPISPQTIAGQTVGTPSYMSPEQAEGREIDARTDIFSFGIMLYQMLSGVLPFTGTSAFAVLASVLRDEPKPIAEAAPGISPALAEVVTRCLRKDPNLRYQSIEDAQSALERERQQRNLDRAGSVRISSVQQPAVPAAPPRRRKRLEAIAAAVFLLAPIAAGGLWYALNRHPAKPTDNTPVRLTSDEGLDTTPAISPDGKLLAYASDRSGEGTLDLWVMQIGSNAQPFRRTKEGADATSPVFSPDGTRIAFRSERNGGGIYITPAISLALSGEEKFVAAEGRHPQFSPDGAKIVYYTSPRSNSNATRPDWGKMFMVDLSAGKKPVPVRADFAAAINPIFTPDGNHLLFIGTRTPDAKQSSHWWVTPLDGGEPVDTGFAASVSGSTDQYRLQIPVAWHGDRVIYSRSDSGAADVREIEISARDWQVSGEPHKLTFGTTHDEYPSFSSDGRLVFASLASNIDIYALPMNTNNGALTGELRRVTRTASVDSVRDISGDGRRLVFLTDKTGHPEVWSHDFDTGAEKQLSDSATAKRQPVITRDGQTVAFADDVEGPTSIYIVPFMGGSPRRVCERCGAQSGWAPDGKHLLVTDYAKARNPILDLDVETGQTREVLRHPQYSLFPRSVSPDGNWISLSADRGAAGIPIAIAPYRAGNPPPESEWIFLTDGKSQDQYPRWSPDGNTIYFVSDRDGHIAILSQRLDPQTKHPLGKPASLYVFSSSLRFPENMLWISVAQDKIVFSLEERTGSIWMLRP